MEFPLHSQQLLSALRTQRQQGFLCDCTVLVGSSHFLAHRAVLASCSPFFHMFFSDSPGSSGPNITLDNDIVTADAFGSLLDFIYAGVLQLEQPVPVEDVLAAASFLHMNGVVKLCRKRLQRRGPLAEADSTRSEDGAGVNMPGKMENYIEVSAAEQMATPPVQRLNPVAMAANRTCCGSSETQVKTPLDIADTTQPSTESSPLLPIIELVHGHSTGQSLLMCESQSRLRTQGPAEVSALCSPCSTTESYSGQQPSSSSLLSSSLAASQPTVTLSQSESQKEQRSLLQSTSHPQIQIQKTVSLHCRSPKLNHTISERKVGGAGQSEASGTVEVKVEAIVISDEELEETKEERSFSETLIDEGEDSDEDLKEDETSSPQYPSFQPTRVLQMASHSTDHISSLSPSSSTSGVGHPSQDSSFPPALFHSSSIAKQASGPSTYFQEFQEGGNFVEDVPTCNVCGKTFSCSYTLRRHATVHTRQRPYECQYCYRSYTQSGDLYRHIRKVHDHTLPAKRSRTDVTTQTANQLNNHT